MKRLQAPAVIADRIKKERKRKSDRKTAQRRRHAEGRGTIPKAQAPVIARALPQSEAKSWAPDEIARWRDALCIWIVEGGSLASFVREFPQGPSQTTWFKWQADDPTFADALTRARECCADTLAEECITIADGVQDAGQFDSARVNAARLAVDARKWLASKLRPKSYADRLETVTSGSVTVTHTMSDDDRAKALAALMMRSAIGQATSLPDARRLIEAQAIDVSPAADKTPAAQPKP